MTIDDHSPEIETRRSSCNDLEAPTEERPLLENDAGVAWKAPKGFLWIEIGMSSVLFVGN
jgi:hypothetical protein